MYVLCAISSVFKSALKSLSNDDEHDVAFILPDIHADQLSNLLASIYCGHLSEVIIPKELEYLQISPHYVPEREQVNVGSLDADSKTDSKGKREFLETQENRTRSRRSFIWDYFVKLEGREASCCNECGKVCNMFSGNTSGLIKHLKNHHQNVYLDFKKKRMKSNVSSENHKNTNKLNLGISKRINKAEMKLKNTKCLADLDIHTNLENIELGGDRVAGDEGDIKNSDDNISNSTQDSQEPDSNETLIGHRVILDACGTEGVEYSSLIMEPDEELGRKNIPNNKVELVTNENEGEANYSSKFFTQVFNRRGEQRNKCIICKKMFYNVGVGASSMLKHLKTKHAEVFNHDSMIKNEIGVVADVNDIYMHANLLPFIPGEESTVVKEEVNDSKSKRIPNRKLSRCLLFTRKQVQGIKKPSLVWNFYTKMTEDTVQCKVCSKIYIARKGTTTSLMKHLRTSHLDYCIDWEKEHIALFDRKMMESDDVPQEHPIWKYYNYMDMGEYVCQLCDAKLLLSDHTTQLETFGMHLKIQHPTTFDECEYEKLILISRKKKNLELQSVKR